MSRWRAASAALLMGSALLVPSSSPAQAATTGVTCPQKLGTKLPVLLVHGFNSTAATWVHARKTLASISASTVLDTFVYGGGSATKDKELSLEWVTNAGTGPLLAQHIQCLADASRRSGGRGKVVVVAHSMGGLALRCAVNPGCNGGRSGVGNDVAVAVTMGTPHLGSFLRTGKAGISDTERVASSALSALCTTADVATIVSVKPLDGFCDIVQALGTSHATKAFKPGSAELAALPPFPSSPSQSAFAVVALAGKISVTESLGTLWHHTLNGDIGDLVVGTASARDENRVVNGVGGAVTLDCGSLDLSTSAALLGAAGTPLLVKNLVAGLTCSHLSETSDEGFLARMIGTITRWSKANPLPPRTLPAPTPTAVALPPGRAGDTRCSMWLAESIDDQLSTVERMISERHLSGPLNGPRLTYASVRAMCAVFGGATPIKRVYSG